MSAKGKPMGNTNVICQVVRRHIVTIFPIYFPREHTWKLTIVKIPSVRSDAGVTRDTHSAVRVCRTDQMIT